MAPAPVRSRLLLTLFAGAVLAIAGAVIAAYRSRVNFMESIAWVEHTSDVKLAIAEANVRLERLIGDGDAHPVAIQGDLSDLRAAEQNVRALTVDNPGQQVRIGRAIEMTERFADASLMTVDWRASTAPLAAVLSAVNADEERLMSIREHNRDSARQVNACTLVVSVLFAMLLASVAVALLWRQRNDVFRAQRELHRQTATLESVVDSVGEAVMAMTPARELLVVNEAARSILGMSFPTDQLAHDWRDTIAATYEDGTAMTPKDAPLARASRGESVRGLVYHIKNANEAGDGKWVLASSRPIRDETGAIIAGVVTLRDITEQRTHAEQLRSLALRDDLTQLYNRRGFTLLAEQHARTSSRDMRPFGIVYADLNGLKRINDELGHELGDRAIKDAARVLKSALRESDIVARLGGDEFVVLIADGTPATAAAIVRRVTDAARTHNERGLLYRVSLSVGLAFYDPTDPKPLEDLITEADRRMYAAKRDRRASVVPLRVVRA